MSSYIRYSRSRIAARGPMEFLLDRGRKIIQVIEKSDNLPDLTIGHDVAPGWHGRSAHSVLDEVEILVLAQARMRLHELGRSWIEGRAVITRRIVRSAVAVGTLVAIQAGAIEQVGLSRRDRIRLPRRMAYGGSIQGGGGELRFEPRRWKIRAQVRIAESQVKPAAECEHDQRRDNSGYEVFHHVPVIVLVLHTPAGAYLVSWC